MEPFLELDPRPPEEPEDTSLDRRRTRKERSVLKLYVCVALSIALLCFLQAALNISLRLYSATSWTKGREHLMDSLGGLTRQGWLNFNQSLYFISKTKKNWKASRDFCLNIGADLLVINSKEEEGFVAKLKDGSWIGLQVDRVAKGIYKWVDGTNLNSSVPIFMHGHDACAVTADEALVMRPCVSQKNWICEKVNVLEHLEAELNKDARPKEKEEEEEEKEKEVPAIIALEDTYFVSVGSAIFVYCRASGQPKPTTEWLYNGRPVKRDISDIKPEPLVFVDGEDLVVRTMRPGLDTVSCLANNSAGTANKTAMMFAYELAQDGWNIFNQSLYFVSLTKRNWTASRDDCLQRKADLVVINSKGEEELATKWFPRTWIGLRLDRHTEETWKWVDGTNLTSSSWLSGDANHPTITEACAEASNGQLIPTPCASQNRWICEKTVQ